MPALGPLHMQARDECHVCMRVDTILALTDHTTGQWSCSAPPGCTCLSPKITDSSKADYDEGNLFGFV